MAHPLLDVLLAAASGNHPPVDGGVTFMPELEGGNRAIVAMTGHAFVATDQDPRQFADLALDGFGAAMDPEAILRVADGGVIGCNDVTLTALGLDGETDLKQTTQWDGHPRVLHARKIRRDVCVYGNKDGFVAIGTGLAGRQEVGIELTRPGAVPGLGRQLIEQALRVVETDSPLFAGVSPGNARSLRSFLAVGFTPLGSEIIVDRSPDR